MFDVGDSPVLTFGNCVLKAGVIKWPAKLYVRFFTRFLRFFQNPKNMTFYVFLSCCTRFLEHWSQICSELEFGLSSSSELAGLRQVCDHPRTCLRPG